MFFKYKSNFTCLAKSVFAVTCVSLYGCANLNTVFHKDTTEFTDGTVKGSVKMVVIDAKERPLTITTKETYDNNGKVNGVRTYVCPDKSPDALSSLATSGGLSMTLPNGSDGSLDYATAEQATSLAFRTQVTETQQVYLYFLCQLNANGGLTDSQLASAMQHYQNSLLAMLAIEQMTGSVGNKSVASSGQGSDKPSSDAPGITTKPGKPTVSDPKAIAVQKDETNVKAAQSTSTSADKDVSSQLAALTKLADPSKNVDAGKVTTAAKGLDSALSAYSKAENSYNKNLGVFNADIKSLPSAGDAPDKVTNASTDLTATSSKAASAHKELTDFVTSLVKTPSGLGDGTDLTAKYATYLAADSAYMKDMGGLQSALMDWGKSVIASSGQSQPINQNDSSTMQDTVAIANAVTEIVHTVVWQSYITESCLNYLFHPEERPVSLATPDPTLYAFCLDHLKKADNLRIAQEGFNIDDKNAITPLENSPAITSESNQNGTAHHSLNVLALPPMAQPPAAAARALEPAWQVHSQ
jgi:hypothetical protein